MKKFLVALSAAVTFAALPSFAIAAPATDPQTTAAVKSMLDAMDIRKAMVASFAEMEKAMPTMMRQQIEAAIEADPSMNAEKKSQVLANLDRVLPGVLQAMSKVFRDPRLVDEMINEMVPLYANNFTTAEINELAAFYRTPLGHKMMATMPRLAAESMAIGQKVVAPRLGKLMEDIMQSVQKQ